MAYGFNDDKTKAEFLAIEDILNLVYPIGAIYMSVNNVDPSTLFGGSWVVWGSGRVPVGVDTSQTEFDTVEETGGAKTHTHTNPTTGSTALTINQIPSHDHRFESFNEYKSVSLGSATAVAGNTPAVILNTGKTGGGQGHTHTMGNTGSTSSLQPYITCYMWKRTA